MGSIVSRRLLVWVYLALMALLLLTFGISRLSLGPFNTLASLAIALGKAALIVAFFMELRFSRSLPRLVAGAGLYWLFILFSLTLGDYLSRGWLPSAGE
ncbi:cytochrome C oxidase subunit IV family protein [bacterium]|nr:cytochrome C oxidase subunit IV family protein [bacterium]